MGRAREGAGGGGCRLIRNNAHKVQNPWVMGLGCRLPPFSDCIRSESFHAAAAPPGSISPSAPFVFITPSLPAAVAGAVDVVDRPCRVGAASLVAVEEVDSDDERAGPGSNPLIAVMISSSVAEARSKKAAVAAVAAAVEDLRRSAEDPVRAFLDLGGAAAPPPPAAAAAAAAVDRRDERR